MITPAAYREILGEWMRPMRLCSSVDEDDMQIPETGGVIDLF